MAIVPATEETIEQAAEALAKGEIVAFPTETVYGLGANALDARAVARVFAAKGRPSDKPLAVLVPGIAKVEDFAAVTVAARKLAQAFWPGPLTLVLPKRQDCPFAEPVSAGLGTIAFRAPDHDVAQMLLAKSGLPIVAPSANRSGNRSPKTAAEVEAELGDRPAMILDGGPSPLGVESTIVSLVGPVPTLLRQGALSAEAIEDVLDQKLTMTSAG
ncbi:MAG: threonylcarbamoyl-AMP synthase [Alphaproteobacteria bacterium]|nr:threonylcarbamoyl-AMP synthase [Alphaproteobacteria bacterium]